MPRLVGSVFYPRSRLDRIMTALCSGVLVVLKVIALGAVLASAGVFVSLAQVIMMEIPQ